ncbi:MAG: glycosyltransferase [Limnohabitans sp.]|nr:glycosyltransferase [Limnohabitans sp.]
MKILYIAPQISGAGGLERVLALKSRYLIEEMNQEVCFITSNSDENTHFYNFSSKISQKDIKVKGFKLFRILKYYKKVRKEIKCIKPDIIIVCDFGWKGFCFNLFVKANAPVVFEVHGSRFNESHFLSSSFFASFRVWIRKILLNTFKHRIFLSESSQAEWNSNGIIIPNPIEIKETDKSSLTEKKCICLARHTYEKGIDRLLHIWREVIKKHPDWTLNIYGEGFLYDDNLMLSKKLELENNVNFYKPKQNIEEIYISSSIYLMTSRQEGFGMVLLEAMNYGLPIIAYDCPVGPREIIENGKNGFLIENDNQNEFVKKIFQLIENKNLRSEIGNISSETLKKYEVSKIIRQYCNFFNEIVLNSNKFQV